MTGTLYRAFTPDLEVRSDGDGRTIRGIAVPYNQPVRIDSRLVEQFAPGAFNHQLRAAHRVRLAREHLDLGGTLIGRGVLMRNDPAGLYVEMRVSETPIGDETLALVKDGALEDLSVGFQERRSRMIAGGITERVKANLAEVAITLAGAYGELATVSGVRSRHIGDEWGPDLDDVDVSTRARAEDSQQLLADVLAKLPAQLPPLPLP